MAVDLEAVAIIFFNLALAIIIVGLGRQTHQKWLTSQIKPDQFNKTKKKP